jgi:hypothetical protein
VDVDLQGGNKLQTGARSAFEHGWLRGLSTEQVSVTYKKTYSLYSLYSKKSVGRENYGCPGNKGVES